MRERECLEQRDQISVRVDAVHLTRVDRRIRVGCGIRSSDRVIEEPVFYADRKWPDCVLTGIVRYRPCTVLDVANEFRRKRGSAQPDPFPGAATRRRDRPRV